MSTVPTKQDFTVNAREAEPVPEDSSNPFADSAVAERYALVYEKAQYECRHAFDPTMTWTAKEEAALVWKLDLHVCLWAVRFPPPSLYIYYETKLRLFSASCFLASKSTEEIFLKLCLIISWTIWD